MAKLLLIQDSIICFLAFEKNCPSRPNYSCVEEGGPTVSSNSDYSEKQMIAIHALARVE